MHARLQFALLFVIVSGCAASPCPTPTIRMGELTAQSQYDIALVLLDQGQDCEVVRPIFESMHVDYPYSRYAVLADLRIAECEAHEGRIAEAIDLYEGFVDQYPTHPEVSHVRAELARLRHES
jgi:outer membrane protein assembly factor BamD (BamD/ComL family)